MADFPECVSSAPSLVAYVRSTSISSAVELQNHSYRYGGENICRLLIIFANSLGPDQDPQKVGPDLDQNGLTL